MLLLPDEAAVSSARARRGRGAAVLQRGRAAAQGPGALRRAAPVAPAGSQLPAAGRRGATPACQPATAVAVHPTGSGQDQGPFLAYATAGTHTRADVLPASLDCYSAFEKYSLKKSKSLNSGIKNVHQFRYN